MFDKRGFSRTIMAQDGDHIPFFDFEIDPFENLREILTVTKMDILKANQRLVSILFRL